MSSMMLRTEHTYSQELQMAKCSGAAYRPFGNFIRDALGAGPSSVLRFHFFLLVAYTWQSWK